MENKKKIESYKDLKVYQKLCKLHLEIYQLTLTFPDFEKYELGAQLRRSSNSGPANLAEGWNNRHINIYLEGINRSLGEIHETEHHLTIAFKKDYLSQDKYNHFIKGYDECGRMLKGLERSLENYRNL